jgi:hypothetical protein
MIGWLVLSVVLAGLVVFARSDLRVRRGGRRVQDGRDLHPGPLDAGSDRSAGPHLIVDSPWVPHVRRNRPAR